MKIERGMTVVYREDTHPATHGKVVAVHGKSVQDIFVDWAQDPYAPDTVIESDWFSPDQLLIVPS